MTSVITEKIRQAPVDAARSSFGSSVVFQSMSLWSAGGGRDRPCVFSFLMAGRQDGT